MLVKTSPQQPAPPVIRRPEAHILRGTATVVVRIDAAWNHLDQPRRDHQAVQGKGRDEVGSPADEAEIDHGVPVFLDQLMDALRLGLTTTPEIGRSAIEHGHDLLLQGFTVSQVVHDYGDICQAITDLAVEVNAPISTDDFRTLNRCLDEAIASAVTEYGREQNQSTLDGESARGSERFGFLAHELRNLTNTAIFAFEVLKTGNVGVAGSTGTVLHRSLMGLRALIGRSLAESALLRPSSIRSRSWFPDSSTSSRRRQPWRQMLAVSG